MFNKHVAITDLTLRRHQTNRINIPMSIYLKIQAYTRSAEGEISGFGKTSSDKTLITTKIEDLQIFNQECNGGYTILKEDDVSNFLLELIKADENPEEWNFWWHSHVDMSVFFSSIDVATMERLSSDGRTLFAIVTNKKGDMYANIYRDSKCIANNEEIFINVIPQANVENYKHIVKKAKKDIKVKVREFKPEYKPYTTSAGYLSADWFNDSASTTKHYKFEDDDDTWSIKNWRKYF